MLHPAVGEVLQMTLGPMLRHGSGGTASYGQLDRTTPADHGRTEAEPGCPYTPAA
ncbi:MAG: hypothetical protein HYS12_20030 [Planctomycetes bacterium]|nr:hypothetical protein [Planctomycetota bacterium]